MALPIETERNGLSLLAYRNRTPEDQEAGKKRAHIPALSFEQPAEDKPFQYDTHEIERTRESHKLQGEYQFDVGLRHDYQSRSTHTNDVKYVSTKIAQMLNMGDESIELVNAIGAMHDLGHMPFSHWGERAASAKLKPYGRLWNHDAAGLRVVTEWAHGGVSYPGLNLTRDTVEGMTKRYWHYQPNEPLSKFNHDINELPDSIKKMDERLDLSLSKHSHTEGQIGAIADWISITATDIEDGLKLSRMTIDEVCEYFPSAKEIYKRMLAELKAYEQEHGKTSLKTDPESVKDARYTSLVRRFSAKVEEMLIKDVVDQTNKNLQKALENGMQHADEVRDLPNLIVGFSPEMLKDVNAFGTYCAKVVFPRIIDRHGPLQEMAERTIEDITNGTYSLPEIWQAKMDAIKRDDSLSSRQQKASMLETACAYMVCIMDNESVRQHIQKKHPELWEQELAEKQVPSRLSKTGVREPGIVTTHSR